MLSTKNSLNNVHHEHEFNRDKYVLFQFLDTSFVQVLVVQKYLSDSYHFHTFVSIISVYL
jgi:hypothetical protein